MINEAWLAGAHNDWLPRWLQVEAALTGLPGDCVVAAAFLSYAGPFPSELREQLVQHTWLSQVRAARMPADGRCMPARRAMHPACRLSSCRLI